MKARLVAALQILQHGVPPPPPPPPPPPQQLLLRRRAGVVEIETPGAIYRGATIEALLDVSAPTWVRVYGEWPDGQRPKEHALQPGDRYMLEINPVWEEAPCRSS